jgi:hypothetical protein
VRPDLSEARSVTQRYEKIAVDGAEYAWLYRHGWVAIGQRLKGASVSVSLVPGKTRELILDFVFEMLGVERPPAAAKLGPAIRSGIRAAKAAGWDPESRGKTFRFEVPRPGAAEEGAAHRI